MYLHNSMHLEHVLRNRSQPLMIQKGNQDQTPLFHFLCVLTHSANRGLHGKPAEKTRRHKQRKRLGGAVPSAEASASEKFGESDRNFSTCSDIRQRMSQKKTKPGARHMPQSDSLEFHGAPQETGY